MIIKKFQAIIKFEMDDEFMTLVAPHRTYINYLINKTIIENYAVSMESQTCWITFNIETKYKVEKYLAKSPLFKYWTFVIEELFVYDTVHYRLPQVQLN
jgi:hypothetical protein